MTTDDARLIGQIEGRLDSVEDRLDKLESKLDRLIWGVFAVGGMLIALLVIALLDVV